MKVESIKFKRHFTPNMSCGTGYSESEVCDVTVNGKTYEIWVDTWYCPLSMVKDNLAEALKYKFGDKCENINEAFKMFCEEWPDRYKPLK